MLATPSSSAALSSRPPRGEWLEKIRNSRSHRLLCPSRPARGEWIEIISARPAPPGLSLAPQGASGLKSLVGEVIRLGEESLAPRGASGLKCVVCHKIIFGKGLAHREASGFPATGAVAPKYSPEGYEPVKRIFDGLKGPDSSLALGIPPFLPAHSHRPMCSY